MKGGENRSKLKGKQFTAQQQWENMKQHVKLWETRSIWDEDISATYHRLGKTQQTKWMRKQQHLKGWEMLADERLSKKPHMQGQQKNKILEGRHTRAYSEVTRFLLICCDSSSNIASKPRLNWTWTRDYTWHTSIRHKRGTFSAQCTEYKVW